MVAANSAPCGDCFYCRRAAPELCEDLLFLNGAYAEAITVPARIVAKNLYAIPDSLSFAEAALTEPLACVVRGMAAVPVRAGETVVVLGLGPIGLLFVRLCVLAGARVLAAGRRAERLALAAELGAAEVFDIAATPDILPALRSRTEGERGPDKVIEAVGRPEAWEQAIALVRKAGTVSLFGGCPAETFVRLDTHRVHYDELTLVGAFHHTPDTFRQALELIARRRCSRPRLSPADRPARRAPDRPDFSPRRLQRRCQDHHSALNRCGSAIAPMWSRRTVEPPLRTEGFSPARRGAQAVSGRAAARTQGSGSKRS